MVRFVLNGQRSVGKVLVYCNLDKKSLDSALDELPAAWTGPHRWCTVFAGSRQDESREEMQSTPSSPYKSYKVFGLSDLHSPMPLASNQYDKYIKHRIFHIDQTVHLDNLILHGFAIRKM